MAFEEVTTNHTFKKATDLAVGDSIEGYLVRVNESRNYPGKWDFIMQLEDGSQFNLSTAGSLKWFALDIATNTKPDRVACVGHWIKIERTPDVRNQKKLVVSQFKVLRDPDRRLGQVDMTKAQAKVAGVQYAEREADANLDKIPF